jgi:hypothetical protein
MGGNTPYHFTVDLYQQSEIQMTKREMNRRIKEMSPELAARVHALVLAGESAESIYFQTTATLRQVNAVFCWTHYYGRIVPQPEVAA